MKKWFPKTIQGRGHALAEFMNKHELKPGEVVIIRLWQTVSSRIPPELMMDFIYYAEQEIE